MGSKYEIFESKCQVQARGRIEVGVTDPSDMVNRRNGVGVNKDGLQGRCHVLHGYTELTSWAHGVHSGWQVSGPGQSDTRDITTFLH